MVIKVCKERILKKTMYIKIKILVKRGKTLKYKKEILQLQGKIDMEKKNH